MLHSTDAMLTARAAAPAMADVAPTVSFSPTVAVGVQWANVEGESEPAFELNTLAIELQDGQRVAVPSVHFWHRMSRSCCSLYDGGRGYGAKIS